MKLALIMSLAACLHAPPRESSQQCADARIDSAGVVSWMLSRSLMDRQAGEAVFCRVLVEQQLCLGYALPTLSSHPAQLALGQLLMR